MASYQEGIYKVQVLGQGLNESTKKGTPGFFLSILPDGGAYERRIQWWLTEKTVEFVLRDLKKLGYNYPTFTRLDTECEGYHNFVGMEFEAACKHEVDPNDSSKVYERWELPYEAAEIVRLDKKGARKLDALFGKQLKAVFSGTDQTAYEAPVEPLTKENTKQQAEAAGADDIPF